MTDLKYIKEFLNENPGYIKVGASRLSQRLKCSEEEAKIALKQARGVTNENTNENSTVLTEFEKFLDLSKISPDDVVSVKFWQTQSGEPRFSVVTKNDVQTKYDYKQDIIDFAESYSSSKSVYTYNIPAPNPVVYEVSLPDIHYGKLSGLTLDEIEDQFLEVIKDLMIKAQGLNIERILLPIGNDGMNSEGMRQSTTKGTPQHDSAGWKETFRGYWRLIVKATDYLLCFAPVDIVVISGNHDYERMYYAGDVLAGWYRNHPNVTVDNSDSSRKYYMYGKNMIMFTHGDNEKPQDMPLIMATEQPEMFSKTEFRETHCGHFHKEQVNEYRGVKVRFLPSICPNDEWHKKMGYDSKRAAQAYIWNKFKGLEGYIQSNIN
jgi:hypothetical protein